MVLVFRVVVPIELFIIGTWSVINF
ncbi:hypothetical protein CY0110_15822 [Crocosphaera chwakensis CCY0110]|uniref:Uncharacterized protein n=1 Tax=Crocosphaera chwakensis CCY0110 TaxID=391612 RepID=A3IHJ6_9CHRO|nr:hypothetical protein CY0110_15822 [Crocosphaera chwakensis CCY0110]